MRELKWLILIGIVIGGLLCVAAEVSKGLRHERDFVATCEDMGGRPLDYRNGPDLCLNNDGRVILVQTR